MYRYVSINWLALWHHLTFTLMPILQGDYHASFSFAVIQISFWVLQSSSETSDTKVFDIFLTPASIAPPQKNASRWKMRSGAKVWSKWQTMKKFPRRGKKDKIRVRMKLRNYFWLTVWLAQVKYCEKALPSAKEIEIEWLSKLCALIRAIGR